VTKKALHPDTAANRWVLPGLVAATFLSLLHYLAFSPLLPAIAADLHLEIGQLGQIPAAIGLGASLIGLIAGPLADRYGKRRMLLSGVLALVAGSAGLALLPGLAALALVAILAALGRATVYPLALAIASGEYEGDEQRRAVSRITLGLGAAPIFGVPLVTTVAAALDWRAAWLTLALATGIAYLWLWKVLRTQSSSVRYDESTDAALGAGQLEDRDRRILADHTSGGALVSAYGAVIGHRPSLTLLGSTFMMGAGGWIIWTYLGAFVIERHGFTTQSAGWAWIIVGLGLLAGTFLAGGRLGSLPMDGLFAGAAIGAGVCLGLSFVLPLSGWLAVGLVGLGTLLHGITQVLTAVLLPNGAPTGRAAMMTFRGAAASLGAAAGAAAGGLLLETVGFAALGASAIACCGVAAALAWWGRNRPVAAVTEQTAERRTERAAATP
jgi:DHA1 family bicyclomycin/chloramphenicol resistance-like MFS transporter